MLAKRSLVLSVLSLSCLVACDTQISIPDATINVSNSSNSTSSEVVEGDVNGTNSGTNTSGNTQTINHPPIIHAFSSNPSNVVLSKDNKITFNIVATDEDNDTLSYTWNATKGTLSATSGLTTHWSPVNSNGELETGIATISVIVNDGKTVANASVNIQMGAENATIDEGSEQIENPDVTPEPTPSPDLSPSPEPSATPTPVASASSSPTPTSSPSTGNTLQPQNVKISNLTTSSFTVGWDTVPEAQSYSIYVDGVMKASQVTGATHTLEGLSPATTYSVRISATTGEGEQPQSEAVSVKTSEIPVVKPTAPQNLLAHAVGNDYVNIAWGSVSGATKYKVYVNGSLQVDGLTEPNTTIEGLTAETAYALRVSAVNAAGESEQSAALNIITVDSYGNKRQGFLPVPAMESMDGSQKLRVSRGKLQHKPL